jgi:hypothetical protein
LKFGIVIPYGSARQASDLAHIAEESGWDGVFLGDAIWCEDPLIRLTAAAMTTRRIRLGTMVIPAPLRSPWTLASQCLAIDHLSEGRLILGLATGATWMGWQGFPDLVLDTKGRVEILEEMVDVLTKMFHSDQFDYAGKHLRVKLSAVDPRHYPPPTIQQPRVPLWIPGVWPRMKSMRRVLKCDGLFPAKMDPAGQFCEVSVDDLAQIKAFLDANQARAAQGGPFDIVIEGKTGDLTQTQVQDKLAPFAAAGMTWWIESTWGNTEEKTLDRIRHGPPGLE